MLLTGAAALAGVALLYPLKIPDNVYSNAGRAFDKMGLLDFFYAQIEPVILFGMSPLLIKEVAGNVALLFLLAVYCVWKIAGSPQVRINSKPQAHWLLWAFLFFAGISLMWSPRFAHSQRSFYTLTLFAFSFVILAEAITRRRDWMKFMWLILGVSFALALISFLQHLSLTHWFMLDWAPIRLRNRIGSFIGHNTGLSAFIMPSLFLALALLHMARSRAQRLALTAFLALLAFVIVAGQSRGVWLTLGFFIPGYFLLARWRLRWALPWRWAIAGAALLAAVTLLQVAPFSWNPFFNRSAPIKKRLDYLLPETMLTETRLRIFICSIPLIGQSPVWGHGIGTFSYVYPKAQGEYISSHPTTRIVPTNLRTDRAHNDWLQIAIELGLIGLALAVAGVAVYARDGWRRLKSARPDDGDWAGLQVAVFTGLSAQLFHALLDFPFHIPPTALLVAVMGALWVSGTRLVEAGAAAEAGGADTGATAENVEIVKSESNSKFLLRPRKVLMLVLILLFLVPIPIRIEGESKSRVELKFAAVELLRFTILPIVADYHQSKGQRFLNSADRGGLTNEDKMKLLSNAFAHTRKAQRLDFMNGEILFDLANLRHQQAVLLADQGKAMMAAGQAEVGEKFLDQAAQLFANSITDVNASIEMGFRYHTSYHLRALNWNFLDQMIPGKGYREKAKADYYTAIQYTPAFGPALQDLSELLIQETPVNAAEVYRLRGMIARYDPQWFKANFIMKAYVALYEKRNEEAVLMLRDLLKAAPEFTELYPALANTYLHMGRAAEALGILEMAQARGVESPELDKAWAMYFILIGRNEEGLRRYKELERNLKTPDQGIYVAQWVALRRLGRMDEMRASKDAVKAQAPDFDAYLTLEGTMLYETFKDREAGVALWREAIASVPKPQSHAFAHLVQHFEREGDLDEARRLLREGLGHHPDDPILLRLKARLLDDGAAQDGAVSAGASMPAARPNLNAPTDDDSNP